MLRYGLAFFLVFVLGLYTFSPSHMDHIDSFRPERTTSLAQPPQIAVMSMLYGDRNTLYERAIKSHERHAARHGLPIHILRNNVADGFWNKPSYILSLLIAELAKNPEERATWLQWVDGDSIIIDPELKSEMFLPPPDFDHINYLVAKDQNGMNTGIFFLRVCDWSIKFMAKALAYPLFRPDIDLGRSADQVAMELVANETEYRDATLYQPRIWYNTYEFHHGYEGEAGRMLVHFPGLEEDRWEHMEKWLDIVEGPKAAEWMLPLEQTAYPAEINRFWAELREARKAVRSAEWFIGDKPHVPSDVTTAYERVKMLMQYGTDNIDGMVEATRSLNEAMGNVHVS
jgi:galactosyl transferase GMA12/MNN10 family